jgi:hypothetical protein
LPARGLGERRGGRRSDRAGVPGNVLTDIHSTEHPVFVLHLGRIVVQKAGM